MAFRVKPHIRIWGDRKSQLRKQCQRTHYQFMAGRFWPMPGINKTVNYLVNVGQKQWGMLLKRTGHATRCNGCLLRVYLDLRHYGPGKIRGSRIRFDCISKYDGFYLFQISRQYYRNKPHCKGFSDFHWTWKLTPKAKRYY